MRTLLVTLALWPTVLVSGSAPPADPGDPSPSVRGPAVPGPTVSGPPGPGPAGPGPAVARPADPRPTAPGAPGEAVPVGVWPLRPAPEVVAPFDPPLTPWGRGHRGVDLAGRTGQPVHAALPGRVTHAAVLAGRGVVVVDHGSTRTTYEPVVADVAVGTRVAAGDRIGRLELVGSHCPPTACLHWGWRRGEEYLDPLLLVGGGPVRLLPPAGTPPAAVTRAGAPAGRRSAAGRW